MTQHGTALLARHRMGLKSADMAEIIRRERAAQPRSYGEAKNDVRLAEYHARRAGILPNRVAIWRA